MQRSDAGALYACSAAKCAPKFEITLNVIPGHAGHGGYSCVDMWRPDGENHWTRHFHDQHEALNEYNKWAAHEEHL
jgi:hypothetical protein